MKQAGTIFRLSAIYRTSDGLDMTYSFLRNFSTRAGVGGLSLICMISLFRFCATLWRRVKTSNSQRWDVFNVSMSFYRQPNAVRYPALHKGADESTS